MSEIEDNDIIKDMDENVDVGDLNVGDMDEDVGDVNENVDEDVDEDVGDVDENIKKETNDLNYTENDIDYTELSDESIEVKPESHKLGLSLGDIIQIYNKSRPELNKVFLIDYIDEEKIKIVSDDSKYILSINKDQTIDDRTIENIDLLYRNPLDGYALQNGLLPNTWATIYFDGDYTSSVTGEITNLEKDMIEITTYPNKDVIYIDFSYKGLPEGILHIRITEPTEIENEPQKELKPESTKELNSEVDEIDADEEDYLILKKNFVEFEIKPKYVEADNIQFGNYMDEVEEEYIVDAKYKRYSLEEQTNDMLEELLSNIPDDKRSRSKLNTINTMIERYVQLLKEFSLYDSDQNIICAEKKGSNFRPLVQSLCNFEKSLYWFIPVAKNDKKNLLDEDDLDKDETIEKIRDLKLIVDSYKSLDSENTYESFTRRLQNWFAPFADLDYNETGDIIVSKPVKDNFNVMINNLGNYQSRTVSCEKSCDFTKNRLFMNYVTGSHSDQLFLQSLITLPEPVVRYSRVNLPGTNIMIKSNISSVFINYNSILKAIKKVNVTPHIKGDCLVDKENKIGTSIYEDKLHIGKNGAVSYRSKGFLNNTKNYYLDMDLIDRDSECNLFEEYLASIIPKTIKLFHLMKKYINGKLSIYSIISTLEPFLIYPSDISFQQYVEMSRFLDEEISNYIKSYVEKTNAYQILKTQHNRKAVNKIATIFINKRDFYSSVIEKIYGYNEDQLISGLELLKNMQRLDYGNVFNYALRQYSSSLNDASIGKKIVDDLESFLTKMSNESDCKTIRFAKRYYSIDILNSDNNKEIYYDKEFDKTPYSIVDDYEKERQQMNDEDFYKHIFKKLSETKTPEESASIIESIKRGRKKVENMDYAIIFNQEEEKLDYYIRKNDEWEYDYGAMSDQPISDELACILRESCTYKKNECISSDTNKDEIYASSMKKIVNEFDKKYERSVEENKDYTTKMLKYYTKCIPKLKEIHKYKLLQYSLEQYKIGLTIGEMDVKQSPYSQLRDMILGQTDIIKKYDSILSFVAKYTVEKSGDDIHWLYCKETDVPLLPKFYYILAKTFVDTPGDYMRKLDLLCATNGKKSDDGDKYVDKYSGYTIRVIDFVKEYGETEDFEEITEPEQKSTNILEKRILNIVKTMETNMHLKIEDEYPFILTTTTQAYNSATISEKEFNDFVSKHGKKTDKTYHNYINTNLLLLTLGVFFITIQTIPEIKIKYSFPGCKKSFTGYPLSNDDDSGIEYIACVASKIKSSIEPWNVLKGKKDAADVNKIKKDLKKMIETNLLTNLEIKDRILHRSQNKEIEIDAGEHSVSNWVHFLPAIIPFRVKEILPLPESFKPSLLRMIKSGDSKQHDSIEAIKSKIILYAYSFQTVIQSIISQKTLLLTNSHSQPFIDNVCCNEKTEKTTLEYFNNENNRVGLLNKMINNLSNLLLDVTKLSKAKTIYSDINTKNSVYVSSNVYNKDVIIRALMIINKHATFTDSHDIYQKKMNEKIEEGVLFTTEDFIQKLKMVGNEQRVLYRESMPEEDLIDLHSEINFKTETDLNNFLVKKIQENTKEIYTFIIENSRFKNRTREIREVEDILKLEWRNVESIEGFYNNISFLKNMIFLLACVFPRIILNKENHDISIPLYWGLTKSDSLKIKACVNKYYADFHPFFSESKNFHDNILSIISRIEKYYHMSQTTRSHIGEGIFGKYSSLLLQKYYLLSIFKQYTIVENDIDETELMSGKTKTINIKITKLLRVFLHIIKISKTTQNIQSEEIMERSFLLKETEKETFTERLERKDEYEREVDNIMKDLGLGDWGIGNKKSLYKYSKNDKDDSLKEKIALAEERLLQNANVTDHNMEQFLDDEIQEMTDNVFMENEDNNLSILQEDYCNDFEED